MVCNDRCLMYDRYNLRPWHAMPMHRAIGYIATGHKAPVTVGNTVVIVIRNTHRYTGHERSPTVVPTAASPGNPRWSPHRIGHPHPTVKIIIEPAPVVKRRPSPTIVRHPCVTIFRIYPIPVGNIGNEITVDTRAPHVSVIFVCYPGTMGLKLVIEDLQ
jgi:hypothetical protein